MIKTVLFDMDGTLLPSDVHTFAEKYFSLLAAEFAPLGYEPKALVDAVWKGTAAMVQNDGSRPNEARFWEVFFSIFGDRSADLPLFDAFYRTRFDGVREVCGFAPEVKDIIHLLKERKKTLVLATNPVFPMEAQQRRLRWAGCDPADFALVTSYENSCFCKPNPAYYTEICTKLSLDPAECLMVGNDAKEDTAAAKIGMKVFLLTPCLIGDEAVLASYPHGDYSALLSYLKEEVCP